MQEWRNVKVGDVLTLQRGFDITRAVQCEGPIPVISSGGVSSYHNVAMSEGPGVVLGRKGTLGKVFYSEGPYWPHDTTLWVKEFKGNLPRFVYYFFRNLDLSYLDVGSANPTLNRNHVHPTSVIWPNLRVQHSIVDVLGALDDKIAANSGWMELCDRLAASLVAAATAGVVVQPLSEIAAVVMGTSPKGESMNEVGVGVPFFQGTRDFGMRTPNRRVYTVDPVRMAKAGNVLLSVRAPVGSVNRAEEECCIGRGLASICTPRSENSILLHVLRQASDAWEPYESSGTIFGSIGRRDLEMIGVPWPDVYELERLVPVIDALENRLMAGDQESRTLAALRDTLLPALMSGRLSVRDAEAAVSEVV